MTCTSSPTPMSRSSVMVSSPPRCSRNSRRPSQDQPAPFGVAPLQRRMPQVEAERLEQAHDALFPPGGEHADLHRVAAVEREADRHRFAVAQLVSGQRFELVGRPVAVVERTRAAGLERIAAVRDLAHVQLGAAPDHARRGLGCAGAQRLDLGLQPLEEHAVADQRDLHRLGDAGDPVARMQRAQEVGIVEHRERRREAAEQILHAERVDAVLDADAGIVLRQHRGRHAHVAHAAMGGGGDVADHVEERAAADRRRRRQWRSTPRSTRRCCRRVTSSGSCLTCSPPRMISGGASSCSRSA